MASYDLSPSIEVFRVRNHDVVGVCDNSDSNQGLNGHQSPIAIVSSFDLENIRSYPGITTNTSMSSFTTQWSTVTIHASNTTKRYKEEGHSRSKTNARYNVTKANTKEIRTRKKRLWMVIRVFMQYLGRKNCQLYRKAHTLVNECVRQHKRGQHFESCNSLSGNIQTCLKKEFGLEHWKRAEYFVAERLLSRHEDRR
jgi:hypothetical protein